MNQKSGILLASLNGVEINNPKDIALFRMTMESTLALGNWKIPGMGTLFLIVELRNGERIKSAPGYPEILFGDFNDEENKLPDYWINRDEISNILIEVQIPNEDEFTSTTQIKIADIKTISLRQFH